MGPPTVHLENIKRPYNTNYKAKSLSFNLLRDDMMITDFGFRLGVRTIQNVSTHPGVA